MQTTAIYPNRIADKLRIEAQYGWDEEGNMERIFYTFVDRIPVAKGYIRIVYGDHGPYVEFDPAQIDWDKFEPIRAGIGYYDIWKASDGTQIYLQRYSVKNLPNPPKGKYSKDNNCKEGYADYKVGLVYISPDDLAKEAL